MTSKIAATIIGVFFGGLGIFQLRLAWWFFTKAIK